MKAVFALCLLCLLQVSTAEEESSLSEAGPGAQALLDREAREAGRRKTWNGKKGGKKGAGRRRKTKNGKKGGKVWNGKKGGKKGRSGRRIGDARAEKNTCLLAASITAIRKFSRATTENNQLQKIINFRKVMAGKKENAKDTFADSAAAIKESLGGGQSCEGSASAADFTAAKEIHDKLANCSVTAAANCDETGAGVTINETALTMCNETLSAFTKGFKECFFDKQDTVCTCMAGLVIPGDDCLDFTATAKKIKAQKKKCTKGSEPGSFGDCRKQERMAAKYGNKCKKGCGSSGTMTTSAPSGRVNMLRKLNKQMKINLN